MQINTRDFGKINIFEGEVINFPNGIFAFENDHRFVLISPCGENKYPMWLQSLDNENLCFIVFDPREIVLDYKVSLDDITQKLLGVHDKSVLDYLVIAVVPDDYANTTVNMKSPIIINSGSNTAVQVISAEDYPLKFPIFKKEEA